MKRSESILEHCKRMEEWIISKYPEWKKSKNETEKKSFFMMGVHDGIFKIPLLKEQFSGNISQAALDQLFRNPSIRLSKDHDIRRKFVAEDLFKNFKKYKFTGSGEKILKIITDQTYSYVTKSENRPNYDVNKVIKIEISDDIRNGIEKYQYYAIKNPDWFTNKKITNLKDLKKLPISRVKLRSSEEFFRWI